jgi:hypothetical protein
VVVVACDVLVGAGAVVVAGVVVVETVVVVVDAPLPQPMTSRATTVIARRLGDILGIYRQEIRF